MKRTCFKLLKLLFFLALCIGCVFGIIFGELQNVPALSSLLGIALGFFFQLSITYIVDMFDDKSWKSSERRLKRAHELRKETKIRISFAYLYRIIIDGKYLLILNSRETKRYQPIGGVYKYTNEEKKVLKDDFNFEYDDKISCDETSKNDYRMYIEDRLLRKFVKRFENGLNNRENQKDVSREFVEEIVEPFNISPWEFGSFNYSFANRFISDVKYSSYYLCYELLIADVYDVELSDEQTDILRQLAKENSDKLYLASTKEIESHGVDTQKGKNNESIANHSWQILISSSPKATHQYKNENYSINLSKKLLN